MGTNTFLFLGFSLGRVPILLLFQSVLQVVVCVVAVALRPWVDPTYTKQA